MDQVGTHGAGLGGSPKEDAEGVGLTSEVPGGDVTVTAGKTRGTVRRGRCDLKTLE